MLEQSTLLYVRHRVVNDFSLVSALIGMALHEASDAQSIDLLRSTKRRVRAVALAYSTGYSNPTLTPGSEEIQAYLTEVVREAEGSGPRATRVRVVRALGRVELEFSELIALGLVASELLTNAIQHAYPEETGGEVRFEVGASEANGRTTLVVADDGVGLAERAPEGVGLRLVRLLTEQLAGELTVASNQGRGTSIRLALGQRGA